MFAITGITGSVGGQVARALLARGQVVRAVMRNPDKAQVWSRHGCEIALAALNNAKALEAAFRRASGVFILLPPNAGDPSFAAEREYITAIEEALLATRPAKVVCLSTIGAQSPHPNILDRLGMMEAAFSDLPMPVAFLRAAWFVENTARDFETARTMGVLKSFLQPLDHPFPMVGAADIGRVAADLLLEDWTGLRVVEVEGPQRVSPNDLAAYLGDVFGRSVRAEAVPRAAWEQIFRAQGPADPFPRMQMLDGFNEGWIRFEDGGAHSLKGMVSARDVLIELAGRARRRAPHGPGLLADFPVLGG